MPSYAAMNSPCPRFLRSLPRNNVGLPKHECIEPLPRGYQSHPHASPQPGALGGERGHGGGVLADRPEYQLILLTEEELIAKIEREKRLIGGLDTEPLSAKPDDDTP